MIVVCAGVIARQPLPGQVWFWLQYLLGFRRLGHDVYFLEDSGEHPYVYDFDSLSESDDPALGVATLRRFLEPFDLGDRWIYRVGEESFGLGDSEVGELLAAADLFLTLPTSVWLWRPEYDRPRVRLFLDGDPGFTQLRALRGDWPINETLERCNRFFTYGPGLAASRIPTLDREWIVTRPPVVLEQWPVTEPHVGGRYTTVMHWSLDPSPQIDGEPYGQKDVEFERVLDLPQRTRKPLEVALNDGPFERLEAHGWHVVSRPPTDLGGYQSYIRRSRGEFSVAKNGYVRARTGWMSERTTCFLATGRPALVQETGLSDWLPTGEGLLTFERADDAATGLDEIDADYDRHCRAARDLAERHFDSDRVLAQLLADAGL